MNIFDFRDGIIGDYSAYISSFIEIRDERIRKFVHDKLDEETLWPKPLLQLNPSYEPGESIPQMIAAGLLHPECENIFRRGKDPQKLGSLLQLHRHQSDALRVAQKGHNYVLTTGTGSGKSLAYIVPIVDHVLRNGRGHGLQAIIVYPMNALANSQLGELSKYLEAGYAPGASPVTFARYTGQESDEERKRIQANLPDILLTNYVMLELLLTREEDKPLINAARGLRFLVLDELHTYRGRQGADVAMLVRRARERFEEKSRPLQVVGTSATLASAGTFAEQKVEVARVASLLFGAPVLPEHVIGETLKRTTPEIDFSKPAQLAALAARVRSNAPFPTHIDDFMRDPLASWIESNFGIEWRADELRFTRAIPRSIPEAARDLASLTGCEESLCAQSIRTCLLAGTEVTTPSDARSPFAFRLHQFISRGDTVYSTLEAPDVRPLTLNGQRILAGVEGDRVLLPMAFCRECGHEFFTVHKEKQPYDAASALLRPRTLSDRGGGDSDGFLYADAERPWPDDEQALLERIPADWIESGPKGMRVARNYRGLLPQPVNPTLDGVITASDGRRSTWWFLPAPFRFCPHCGVEYSAFARKDFGKLALLTSEGRSTATTVLSIAAVQRLRTSDLAESARKLLSFTDNRQDASLQAGHFNDYVEIGLLRGALCRAVAEAGEGGLTHDQVSAAVFNALNLPFELYARDASQKFGARREVEAALREVIAYRLYRDLQRGWRVTAPNLEQCGLLHIEYRFLDELCADEETWRGRHPLLADASPAVREKIATVLLDHMRRRLAIRVDVFDPAHQEKLSLNASQRLRLPWSIDPDEKLEHAALLVTTAATGKSLRGVQTFSAGPRSAFGRYLRRPSTFDRRDTLKSSEVEQIVDDLLSTLQLAGLTERDEATKGWRIPAAQMLWRSGDGTQPRRDPLATPQAGGLPPRVNKFFVDYYQRRALQTHALQAREHTAQVPAAERMRREDEFRKGTLPVLYCSPTMELGVDIADLNVVNMRNMPPTPANYAQRSGRAGRSGQPALVFTYCATGNAHDQYFFRRPKRMVAGSVAPPRLDLANEELIRAHIHAIWLAETGLSLGSTLRDLLDLTSPDLKLDLHPRVREAIEDPDARRRAFAHAREVLRGDMNLLRAADWFDDDWIARCLQQAPTAFDRTCDRWRELFRAAKTQYEAQGIRAISQALNKREQDIAAHAARQARAQITLLTEPSAAAQSDFYSYRYFASEGFLPGYSFPRLPVSAFIPAHGGARDEYVSRPRFLAITEFGPQAIVYHEGSRYKINRALLPVDPQRHDDMRLPTETIKRCPQCAYLNKDSDDQCRQCNAEIKGKLTSLLRMHNVEARRHDRINSDEEERTRMGYELQTALRFAEGPQGPRVIRAEARDAQGDFLARLEYAPTAEVWSINMGWRRRGPDAQSGFVIDVQTGNWQSNKAEVDDGDGDGNSDEAAFDKRRTERVIPYVDDRRNCLIFEMKSPHGTALTTVESASLQAALKHAVQVYFQLEDIEVKAEPLPDRDHPTQILFIESTEGGAGVLRRLVYEQGALAEVAREALRICHFDPHGGEDLGGASEPCTAACYDCLMSYGNQGDHHLLDRRAVRELLMAAAGATVTITQEPSTQWAMSAVRPEADQSAQETPLNRLLRLSGSDLERRWLRWLDCNGLRLPTAAQKLVEPCRTRPDFEYEHDQAVIYIDGPVHEYPERADRDAQQRTCMEDLGYTVIVFSHDADWTQVISKFKRVFGGSNGMTKSVTTQA